MLTRLNLRQLLLLILGCQFFLEASVFVCFAATARWFSIAGRQWLVGLLRLFAIYIA